MKLPVVSGRELIKALSKIGYRLDHVTGSHYILYSQNKPEIRLTVPFHRELDKGTLLSILKQAGLTREQLDELL